MVHLFQDQLPVALVIVELAVIDHIAFPGNCLNTFEIVAKKTGLETGFFLANWVLKVLAHLCFSIVPCRAG